MTAIVPPNTGDNSQQNTVDTDDFAQQKEKEVQLVNFWKNRIQSTRKLRVYDEFKKNRDEAKSFYRGDSITDTERSAWEGDLVQCNLFRRTVNFMSDAVYSQNPHLKVGVRAKLKQDPNGEHYATSIKTHLQYIWDEEKLGEEIRRTFKDSYFTNLAAAKIDFDKERGLWRAKWVAGDLVCDPNAFGDLSRARWLAEFVQMPRYRVWQDETFDPKAREELRKRSNQQVEDQIFSEMPGGTVREVNRDLENIWYIYTKEGVEPINPESPWNTGKGGFAGKGKIRLLVIAENFDQFLLNIEDPAPYLNNDEFPYAVLRLDELPGEFIGPALWRQVESIVRAFNWSGSYMLTDMRKVASRPVMYNEDTVSDPELLKSRKHMVPIAVKGNPKDAIGWADTGQSDQSMLKFTEFWKQMLDWVTGVDDIARGEEGKTKTATESQILSQNSSITMKGPQQALDNFMNDLLRKIALATLYYTPAWSITIGQNNVLMTRQPQQMPIMGPMGPMMDPATGQPQMQTQIQQIPAQLTPEQALMFHATLIPTPMGTNLAVFDGQPDPKEPFLVKGIDYFHGDQIAQAWPQLDFDTIKNDLDFAIEAGTSRQEARMDRQKAAMSLFETFGPIYQQFGLWDNYWEVMNIIVGAFDQFSLDAVLPDKQRFMQAAQQMMMMQQMMAQQQQAQQQPPPNGKNPPKQSHKFEQTNSPGKQFPLGEHQKPEG